MYKFVIEKKEEFLNGRTIKFVADNVATAPSYLSNILAGKFNCSKKLAMALCSLQGVDLEYYFIEVEEKE